ncbi:AH receptor-interacting protein [Ischnura elegans]|uniref:AH receptor-interacting protein n=1 Tax=Ischnura elegans TaxID=197161 RepID=UPI001ED8A85E|nr:AH receptor-interacting protein [Ischnura elegans]
MDFNGKKIEKKILHAGTAVKPYTNGTKVFFHFQTKLSDDNKIIDDSRKLGKPMELVLGKKFKLEVWEAIVQTMSINEVACFSVDKSLVASYPFVSKTLREAHLPKEAKRHHCCGVSLQNEGIGYQDLNELIKVPKDLEFTIEILKVESPEEYQKESWQMDEDEKVQRVSKLRTEGNDLYNAKKYDEAVEKYSEALGMLEQLMLKEKPGDEEWLALQSMKIPLLLNFSQCKLIQNDYYMVIEHCSSVLKSEPNNVKALFRRGKAHIGAWNPKEAREDLEKTAKLDPKLSTVVIEELKRLEKMEKQKDREDASKLKGKLLA